MCLPNRSKAQISQRVPAGGLQHGCAGIVRVVAHVHRLALRIGPHRAFGLRAAFGLAEAEGRQVVCIGAARRLVGIGDLGQIFVIRLVADPGAPGMLLFLNPGVRDTALGHAPTRARPRAPHVEQRLAADERGKREQDASDRKHDRPERVRAVVLQIVRPAAHRHVEPHVERERGQRNDPRVEDLDGSPFARGHRRSS